MATGPGAFRRRQGEQHWAMVAMVSLWDGEKSVVILMFFLSCGWIHTYHLLPFFWRMNFHVVWGFDDVMLLKLYPLGIKHGN